MLLLTALACGSVAELADRHNAVLLPHLEPEVIPIQDRLAGTTLDWSGLRADMQGRPLAPDEVARLELLQFPGLSPGEVAEGLVFETLDQRELALAVWAEADGTRMDLAALGLARGEEELGGWFVEGSGSWLVLLMDEGDRPLRAVFLEPRRGSEVDRVELIGAEPQIEVVGALGEPVVVRAEDRLDWAAMSVDTLGGELVHRLVDGALLGRVEAEPEELERELVDLEVLALETVELDLSAQTELDLLPLRLQPGQTWVLALQCSTCLSPAPRVLSVLEVK